MESSNIKGSADNQSVDLLQGGRSASQNLCHEGLGITLTEFESVTQDREHWELSWDNPVSKCMYVHSLERNGVSNQNYSFLPCKTSAATKSNDGEVMISNAFEFSAFWKSSEVSRYNSGKRMGHVQHSNRSKAMTGFVMFSKNFVMYSKEINIWVKRFKSLYSHIQISRQIRIHNCQKRSLFFGMNLKSKCKCHYFTNDSLLKSICMSDGVSSALFSR